ncbi:MAG: NADPH-dependent glutamate synthase [Armatimonadetes bacterium]|nr:NADPH-dependent glutamate synthase [Armatimonadota bacterium]HOM82752.1 NADPH-dependent glutamate synthase [Armatimonadota bacterium]HPO74403.1 NADPH-dependent glutamate synthase [Armatimonadota bacterium]
MANDNKRRLAIPRQHIPTRPVEERIRDYEEVAIGFSEEEARREAERCLQCKHAKCMEGCPVSVHIPAFIKAIAEGRDDDAVSIVREQNLFPAICGRVCPQETQCEQVCTLAKKYGAVAIGALERYVADHARKRGANGSKVEKAAPTGRRVAVIGSGPAGLAAAGDLARQGHDVTIFEALHRPGGVLVYGIPEFRLPKAIVAEEIAALQALGVKIETNVVIGRTITIDELFAEGYDAVFVGSGAGLPMFLGIPGENLCGVYSANEFLTRMNLMRAFDFPNYDTPIQIGKHVAVIGGGNVAMDAARVALRMGPEKVTILYRRSRAEMPARLEEIERAEEEGVHFELLVAPTRMLGDDRRWVTGVECQRMELGEPDASGRRRPVPVPGSEFVVPADTVVVAIGNHPHPLVPQTTPGMAVTKKGTIVADPETGATPRPGLFAGGDIVTGAATVILAMGAGRRAARAISEYLNTLPPKSDT